MTPANIVGMAKVIGLDVIALTDHNSCKNCAAFVSAAQTYGITAICGMELCTAEEVHVLCYFPSLEDALAFDNAVSSSLPDIPNTPSLFGNQLIYDDSDRIAGTESTLLISASDIPFHEVYPLVYQFHGIMVPAHIDKPSNSLLGNLGFIPPDSQFSCAEVKNLALWEKLQQEYPYLQNCNVLSSSDAHDFNSLHEPVFFLDAAENTPSSILQAISKPHNVKKLSLK